MCHWCLAAGLAVTMAVRDDAEVGRRLRIVVAAHDRPDVGGSTDVRLDRPDGGWSLAAPVTLPVATVQRVEVEGPGQGRGKPRVVVQFQGTEEQDPDRRYLVEVWASNAEGRVLWHSWQLQHDARLNKPRQMGSRVAMPAVVNFANFHLPPAVAPRLRTLKVQLRAMRPVEYQHQPSAPSEIDLAMSRPAADGRFTLSFAAPVEEDGTERPLDPARQRVAVTLVVKDAAGQVESRDVRFAEPKPGGRYRFGFRLDSKQIDRAEVGIDFYDLQPGQPEFAQRFFVEGKGTSYSGGWLGLRRPLREVPLTD